MQQGQIIDCFLIPSHQDASESVHPAMGSLDDPAAGLIPRLTCDGLRFFASTTDMGCKAELGYQVAHCIVIVSFVQAQPLRRRLRRLRPGNGQAGQRRFDQFTIVPVGSRNRQAKRNTGGIRQEAALDTELASIGRIAPDGFFFRVFFGTPGALVMQPSMDSQLQSMPLSSSYSRRPCFQSCSKTPAFAHSWKRRCAEEDEQIPVALSAFHWQPVRNTKKIASMATRSGTRRRWQPRGWDLRAGKRGAIRSHSRSGMRHGEQESETAVSIDIKIVYHDLLG